jgi:hypothetical protein
MDFGLVVANKTATPAKSDKAAARCLSVTCRRSKAEAVLGDLMTLTTRHPKKGDKIRLTGRYAATA